eukprot:2231869-Rhodomonas_salina.2
MPCRADCRSLCGEREREEKGADRKWWGRKGGCQGHDKGAHRRCIMVCVVVLRSIAKIEGLNLRLIALSSLERPLGMDDISDEECRASSCNKRGADPCRLPAGLLPSSPSRPRRTSLNRRLSDVPEPPPPS